MLLRPGPIPSGEGWAFELKYDGFRAIVSTEGDLRVRSRRGWNMTTHVPELRELSAGLVLDGELVAFNEAGAPHWPLVCERVLHGNRTIPVTFVAFDLLRVNGHDVSCNPWADRRALLEELWQDRPCARLADGRPARRDKQSAALRVQLSRPAVRLGLLHLPPLRQPLVIHSRR